MLTQRKSSEIDDYAAIRSRKSFTIQQKLKVINRIEVGMREKWTCVS
jgi:hypothetical protein